MGLAEGADEELAEFPVQLRVDLGVDGLVGDPLGRCVGVHLLEPVGDLLRRPAPREAGVNRFGQRRIGDQLPRPFPTPPACLSGGASGVVARAVVPAPDLPADLLADRCSLRASVRWLNRGLRSLWMWLRWSVVNRHAA